MATLTHRIFCADGQGWNSPFHIRSGQIHTRFVVAPRGDWFNQRGLYLGSGDLCGSDVEKLSELLDPGCFFIVHEKQRFPRHVAISRPLGWEVQFPEVLARCSHIISHDQRLLIRRNGMNPGEFITLAQQSFLIVTRAEAIRIITSQTDSLVA